ncbi:hypothetical protein PVK06_014772 [Gossypium arboreum]|uniref:Uncharacterized protein n=1 Tax=Gossypium arboreum TaxID=29729 RepID=A0ABR0PVY0_GOSAR|nr:hypothetical protein PVK06_014772 [Gossypium arboreum]
MSLQESYQNFKIKCGSSLLSFSGCLCSSGPLHGMGGILVDQIKGLDLEDNLLVLYVGREDLTNGHCLSNVDAYDGTRRHSFGQGKMSNEYDGDGESKRGASIYFDPKCNRKAGVVMRRPQCALPTPGVPINGKFNCMLKQGAWDQAP